MFGHALPLGTADFWDGAPVEGVVVEVVGVLAAVLDELVAAVVGVVDAADALVIPAAAPAVASAPATMVAPSSLEMVMVEEPPGFDWWGAVIVRELAKRKRSWA
jgi:hypothetical protein